MRTVMPVPAQVVVSNVLKTGQQARIALDGGLVLDHKLVKAEQALAATSLMFARISLVING